MGPAQLNDRNGGYKLSPVIKTIASGLIVLFLGGVGTYIWELKDQIENIRHEVAKDYVLMAVHKRDLDRLNAFMVEGRRFTLERGEDVEDEINDITSDHKLLQLKVTENSLTLAAMPHVLNYPFDEAWRQRISALEKLEALNAERIEELRNSLSISPKKH